MADRDARWQNWARTATCEPVGVMHPSSPSEVAAVVRRAVADGHRVKAIGAGHSFTPIGVTDGVLVVMDRLNAVLDVDSVTMQVTVGGGITLRELSPLLRKIGLALPNMGDVDPQTITGAISTGTHGTGGNLRGIADAVVGLDLVAGDGRLMHIGQEDLDLLAAARVGLGALGIITSVTLQCVPAFLLHAREQPMRLGEVLDDLDGLVADNDHFEFYWFPHTDRTLTKRNNRVPDDRRRRPVGPIGSLIADEVLGNGGFEMVNRLALRRRDLVPRLNTLSARLLSGREYVDDSHNVFVSARRVRFREMEYAIPRHQVTATLEEIDSWISSSGEHVTFPVEVRFAAPDDIWMSTGYQRANAYVAVHQYHRMDYRRYFAGVEAIFAQVQGRPHWGKMHTLDAQAVRERYPRFDDFVAVRDRLDPLRTFGNDYLDQILGDRLATRED